MKKVIPYVCFVFPLVFSTLNLQGFVLYFFSDTIAKVSAYLNLVLILLGLALSIKKIGKLSPTGKLWMAYFFVYYIIGLIASIKTGFDAPVARTIVPIVYFIGFYYFMSNEGQRKLFLNAMTLSLVASCIATIVLLQLNFDFDYGGFHIYKIDRAGGVYGDANNAALVCILAYLFFNKMFVAHSVKRKIIKIAVISMIFYSLFLTFSTTGLSTFLIVMVISNYRLFKGLRIVLLFASVVLLFLAAVNLSSLTSGLDLLPAQRVKIENLSNVLTLNTDKVDNSGRGELLENMMNFIYENPILGNGIDFAVTIRGHNTYMGVWADAGIFTFVFFIGILLTYAIRSYKLSMDFRIFNLSVLFALYIFMLSLQTVINQAYIIVIFAYLGYLIDFSEKEETNETYLTAPNALQND